MITEIDVALTERLTPPDQITSSHGVAFIVPELQAEPYPEGFWNSINRNGAPAGLGFYCSTCHLSIPGNAPHVVRHCHRLDVVNRNFELLTHQLGSGVTYRKPTTDDVVAILETRAREERLRRVPDMATPSLFESIKGWAAKLLG